MDSIKKTMNLELRKKIAKSLNLTFISNISDGNALVKKSDNKVYYVKVGSEGKKHTIIA